MNDTIKTTALSIFTFSITTISTTIKTATGTKCNDTLHNKNHDTQHYGTRYRVMLC
jgi:hypothetical protein